MQGWYSFKYSVLYLCVMRMFLNRAYSTVYSAMTCLKATLLLQYLTPQWNRWFLGLVQADPRGSWCMGQPFPSGQGPSTSTSRLLHPALSQKYLYQLGSVLPMKAAGSCSALGWFTDLCSSCAAVNQLFFFAPAFEIASYKTGIGICKELGNLSNFLWILMELIPDLEQS